MSPLQPVIIPRSEHTITRAWISQNAIRVLYKLKENGYRAYLVGGGVRDLLLGREPKDFDIATDATPREVKKVFRSCRLIGRRFRLAHIHFPNEIIEVATFRSMTDEQPETEQAAPDVILSPPVEAAIQPGQEQFPDPPAAAPTARPGSRPPRMLKTEDGMILRDNVFGTPEEDALRRDFTVNALFYNIADYSVIDYVGGMEDLKRGLIRIIGDPVVRFTEDPVRMVRAVRFAALLGFDIEQKTYQAMLELRDRVALASPSRMYEEVLKLFLLGEGEKTYQLLRKTGLFGVIFPRLNEWIDTEADGFPHIWIGKALEWVDACVTAGRKVEPHILFGLMLGQYCEERAAGLRQQGAAELDAVTRAVQEFMTEQVRLVQIPRKVSLLIRDMYWNQHRFERRDGKHPRYFIRRPGFADAFEYLRLKAETIGDKRELRAWWEDFIKANPLAPAEERDIRKTAEKKSRPKRRRRRRGGRKGPEAPKPQA